MNDTNFNSADEGVIGGIDSPNAITGSGLTGARPSLLSNKLTSVLSTSYADSEIRDALRLLDAKGIRNNAETRRNLRLELQKEVIKCNAQIVDDFGKVAEVSLCWPM
jgi:conserved oligomeric Golgi complex subunit 6